MSGSVNRLTDLLSHPSVYRVTFRASCHKQGGWDPLWKSIIKGQIVNIKTSHNMPVLRPRHHTAPAPTLPSLPPNEKSTNTRWTGTTSRMRLNICSLCTEGRHQIQACPLYQPSSPVRILRRFDLCPCREILRTVNVDRDTHIERTVVERFLCDYHLPRQQDLQQEDQHQEQTEDYGLLDLDNQPSPSSLPPPPLPDHQLSCSSLPSPPPPNHQPYPSPPPPLSTDHQLSPSISLPPPSPPPLHHLPLPVQQHDAPGPTRRIRKQGRNPHYTPEEITATYNDIHEEVKRGKLLKEVLPTKGFGTNSTSWRRIRSTAEIIITSPAEVEELFSADTWTGISKKATELSKRPDIRSAITAARKSKLII